MDLGTKAEPQMKKENDRKGFPLGIFLLSVLFLMIVVIIFWLYARQPAIGDIHTSTADPQKADDTVQQDKQYSGKYLSFSYPAAYREKVHETPLTGPVKEVFFLSADTIEGRKMAITVEERESSDFEASPSFQLRRNKPEMYEEESILESGFKGILFRKNSVVFERTFFFHHRNLIVIIATTSPFNDENIESELFTLLATLRFRD